LHRVLDLGVWWHEQTGMPYRLEVMRCGEPRAGSGREIARTDSQPASNTGLEHREEALNYAHAVRADMETELADQFVACTWNKWTLGYGDRGKRAVTELITWDCGGPAAGPAPWSFWEKISDYLVRSELTQAAELREESARLFRA